MKPTTKSKGDLIEDLAQKWWMEQDHLGKVEVLCRNFRCRFGEIDLILEVTQEERVELVFVEIRSRTHGSWISGLESVTFPKQMRLRQTIERYLTRYKGRAQSVRCDVMDWNGSRLAHYPDAWRIF